MLCNHAHLLYGLFCITIFFSFLFSYVELEASLSYQLVLYILQDNIAVIAGEDSEIVIYDFNKKVVLQRFEAHKVR